LPITSRHKTPESIVEKLCRSTTALSRMQDIAGTRVVVPGIQTQEAAMELTEGSFAGWSHRLVDMRDAPTNFGYRAVHILVEREQEGRNQYGEIQLRTRRQELWAQTVERIDKDFGYDLKHGNGRSEWLEWLQELSDELRKADLGQHSVIPPTPLDLRFGE
jgi:putative GTP pyrophosphokinase